MRVSINGRYLTQPLTGVQRYSRELVGAIDRLLVEGELADIEWELLVPADTEELGALERVDVRRVGRRSGHPWEQVDLPAAARGDVLFCPANTAPIARLLRSSPTVVTVHGLSFLSEGSSYRAAFRWFYRTMVPLVLRRAKTVITVSDAEREAISQRFPHARERLVAVQHGAIPHAFEEALSSRSTERTSGLPAPATPFVLFVGTPAPVKNLGALLRALELLPREATPHGLDLVVVGAGAQAYRETDLDVPVSLRERVRFEGQLSDDQKLIDLYREATCLVFPSRYESSGLPPLEAMACGCPVVCSDLPALRERCGDAAVYFDPEDPVEICSQLERVLRDSELRTQLTQLGRTRAQAYSWERCARETAAVLRSSS